MPSTAALVKEAIGNTRAAAMDVAAACSGFVYGFATAQAWIEAGLAKHVLVIGAELLTRFLDYTDRSTCILFGDGAGAAVLSASTEPGGALGIELTTEPQGAYMIWLPAGGAKSPPSAETIARGEHYIRMEGKETYRFATKTMATTALESVRKSGLQPSDISLFIPHQANVRIIEAVAKGLGLSMDQIYTNVDRYGNTSAASVPIAMAEAVNEGRIKVGDRITVVAFGAGFTSGAVTIEWTADPARGRIADAAIRPEDVHVRLPVDWDSVDPIPPALAELMARPGPSTCRSTTSSRASPSPPRIPSLARRVVGDRSVGQVRRRHRRLARDRPGDRAPARRRRARTSRSATAATRRPRRRPPRRSRRSDGRALAVPGGRQRSRVGRRADQGGARGVRQGRHPRQQRRHRPATT